MTINDNTTKINTIKNTTLPELLQKINSLPDAGSGGGGGSVETCTVKVIERLGYNSVRIGYTALIDGEVRAFYISPVPAGENVYSNVIIGSLIQVAELSGAAEPIIPLDMVHLAPSFAGIDVYEVAASADSVITITIG